LGWNSRRQDLRRSEQARETGERDVEAMRKRVREVEEKLVVLEDMRRKSAEEGRKLVLLRQSSVDMTGRWQKGKAVREQSEGELDVVRKDLRKVHQDVLKFTKYWDAIKKN